VREDIGRHNAVDKVIGWAAMNGAIPADDRILVVSGRAGFEIVQKAAVAGIATLVSVSAPSSLAVDAAGRLGVTLVGFARGERFTTYAGAVAGDEGSG
jgi:FdhD protein